MEKHGKAKKQMNEKTTISPLQDLNGRRLPINLHKLNSRKSSNLPFSSADEAPKGCLQLPLSSKTSSSRTHLHKMSKVFSKVTAHNEPRRSKLLSGSKENDIPRKPFSQKSKYSKNNTKPTCKSGERSKLQSVQGSKMKNKSQYNCSTSGEMPFDLLQLSQTSHLTFPESCTSPVGENVTSRSGLGSVDSFIYDFSLNERDKDNNSSTKTPPIEASLSPEIQLLSHSKILLLESAKCYGTGHLFSGVTDKRKCRRRGSLNGSLEKIKLYEDKIIGADMINDGSHDYSIPFLAEASVRWDLSPCDDQDQCRLSGVDNVDCVGSTLDNLALSRMRISWRDGILGNSFVEKENYLGDVESGQRVYTRVESYDDDKEDGSFRIDDDPNQMLLDCESKCISAGEKEKTSPNRCNAYAESRSPFASKGVT